jgi:hypothetical protein
MRYEMELRSCAFRGGQARYRGVGRHLPAEWRCGTPSLLTHHGSRRLPARSQDEALRARERVRRARKAERERALAAEEASLEAVGHCVLFCSVLFCSVRLSVFCYSILSVCLSVCLSVFCLSTLPNGSYDALIWVVPAREGR